ncbi:hypothetical protein CPC16_003810, partial [Podila verticillata]
MSVGADPVRLNPSTDNVHRFLRLADGRYWIQVESFYKYRDPFKTSYQHFELYRDSLETIMNRKIVATKLKTLAEKLLERLSYDEFITTFTGLLGKHEENRPSPRTADGTRIPEMDAVVLTEESTERSNLYKIALQHIHGTVEQQARPNFDRTHCLDYKVAFVAMSGTWNTFSACADSLFESLATDEVKALCYMNSLDQSNGGVEQFVKGLLQLKTLGHKLHRVYKLKNDQPDCRGILQALEKLIIKHYPASAWIQSSFGGRVPVLTDAIVSAGPSPELAH